MLGAINVVGGILVIGSYVQGLKAHPALRDGLWGHVPLRIRPFYGVSGLLAAAGYLAFTYFVMFSLEPDEAEIANTFSFKLFLIIYALILFPSALWMPLTFAMLENPSRGLWREIRITLAVVGLASLGMLAALLGLNTREPAFIYWLAVAGTVAFCIQTALLDALVWPAFFPVKR